jgi:type VI secretion system secreted protein Hcp
MHLTSEEITMRDIYMLMENIAGETTIDGHSNEVELLGFSYDIDHPYTASRSSSGSHGAGAANFGSFKIIKELDKASPKVALFCAKGDAVGKITLKLCRNEGKKEPYMVYELTNAKITKVFTPPRSEELLQMATKGNGNGDGRGGDHVPVEEVHFTFDSIKWTYNKFGNDGSNQGAAADHNYNLATGVGA